MRQAKLIVGMALVLWAALLFLNGLNPKPPSVASTDANRYVDIAVLLTPFVFVAVGLSLILSARRTSKR